MSAGAVINSVDPDLPMDNVKTMEQLRDESFLEDRSVAQLFGIFAVAALLLAAIGIYGVAAFSAAQRTREIGLRIALGAERAHVLGLLLTEGLFLALIGLALGLAGASFVGRAMRGILYGVGTIDTLAFAVVSALLLGFALIACYLPARRAAKVDPMVALRYE